MAWPNCPTDVRYVIHITLVLFIHRVQTTGGQSEPSSSPRACHRLDSLLNDLDVQNSRGIVNFSQNLNGHP